MLGEIGGIFERARRIFSFILSICIQSEYRGPENICDLPGTHHKFRVRCELGSLFVSLAAAPRNTELQIMKNPKYGSSLLRVAAFAGNVAFAPGI